MEQQITTKTDTALTASARKLIADSTNGNAEAKRGRGPGRFVRHASDMIPELLNHVPRTGIIERIKEATRAQQMIAGINISPAMALDILTLNPGNRPIKRAVTLGFADVMKDDQWDFTGDPYQVSKSMRLLNGQKRLIAQFLAGKTLKCNIQCGVDDRAFNSMDSGQKRNIADGLAIDGHKNAVALAAAIRSEIYFRLYQKVGGKISEKRVTNREIGDWPETQNIKRMSEAVQYSVDFLYPNAKFLSQSNWAFLYYILADRHKGEAKEFLDLLATGANISPDSRKTSPIYYARKHLVNLTTSSAQGYAYKQVPHSGKVVDTKMRYIMRAWNMFRAGEKVTGKFVVDLTSVKIEKPR